MTSMRAGRALVDEHWVDGTILPGFCDSHVHLALVDAAELMPGGIARVIDLGWDPAVARRWPASAGSGGLGIDIAGAILTSPGGYPGSSGWAPSEAAREIRTALEAESAIADIRAIGGRVAKIALNSTAGPVWGDDLLETVVSAAHRAGLPVVAHAEGTGQAARALIAGVDALAHTPWTEHLDDGLLRSMAERMSWISTIDIHGYGSGGPDFERAIGNLERFAAAGGRVHYGTDLGNGPLPTGLNHRELAALTAALPSAETVIESLAGFLALPSAPRTASFIPGPAYDGSTGLVDWLCTGSVVPITHLEETPA
ncbi:amidohydrolase [Glaciihabitans sp. INWT7]|uniref:amidohydrolase family protein n=1 Tax=Glaciihabitans sp. INWT7 TaxID=2596912 RepID=UPI00162AD8F4|nr:amidohydrolase [Glaciihabitans sp. INWT7]QNE45646.1 amidohydrolase [Glaciihabitans sp. INWT7]